MTENIGQGSSRRKLGRWAKVHTYSGPFNSTTHTLVHCRGQSPHGLVRLLELPPLDTLTWGPVWGKYSKQAHQEKRKDVQNVREIKRHEQTMNPSRQPIPKKTEQDGAESQCGGCGVTLSACCTTMRLEFGAHHPHKSQNGGMNISPCWWRTETGESCMLFGQSISLKQQAPESVRDCLKNYNGEHWRKMSQCQLLVSPHKQQWANL